MGSSDTLNGAEYAGLYVHAKVVEPGTADARRVWVMPATEDHGEHRWVEPGTAGAVELWVEPVCVQLATEEELWPAGA